MKTKAKPVKEPKPLWWGSLAEYPEEGAVCVSARTEAGAMVLVRDCLDPDGDAELIVTPVTERDIEKLQEEIERLELATDEIRKAQP